MAIQSKSDRGALSIGAARGIAFGGGGEWFLAWILGYSLGMREHGVDLGAAEVTIGSSAGSLVGTAVKSEHLWRLPHELALLGKHPSLANKLLSISHGAPSQGRAIAAVAKETSTDQDSIRDIGRAAMAAHNSPVEHYVTRLQRMLGRNESPNAHFTTAVDCFTGETIIVSKSDGIPIATACAASSSVPGINGPVSCGLRTDIAWTVASARRVHTLTPSPEQKLF